MTFLLPTLISYQDIRHSLDCFPRGIMMGPCLSITTLLTLISSEADPSGAFRAALSSRPTTSRHRILGSLLGSPLGRVAESYPSCPLPHENLPSFVCRPSYQLWLLHSQSGVRVWSLSTNYHLTRSSVLYSDSIDKASAHPKAQALLVTGTLRTREVN